MNAATQVATRDESKIVDAHDSRIRYLALPFARRGVLMSDLIQEGRIALVLASRSWRPDGGAALWTYASKFVLGAMFRFATKEIASPVSSDDVEAPTEDLSPEDALEIEQCLVAMVDAFESLTETERLVLRLHFDEGLHLKEISRFRGESSCIVVQRIYHRALAKLRTKVEASL